MGRESRSLNVGSLRLLFLIDLVLGQSGGPCSPPQSIEHGTFVLNETSSVARYACFQGFHLVGPPRLECRYGTWYSDTAAIYPSCKPIVCNHPSISNGRLESSDSIRYRSGQEASVVCDEGYELRGGISKISCKEDGSWEPVASKDFPTCKEKNCQQPENPAIENGSLEINVHRSGVIKPGSVATYHCNPGFVLLPISAVKKICRKGVWEGAIPACVPQSQQNPHRTHCPAPPSINNGYYLTDRVSETPLALPAVSLGGEQYEFGTVARYQCQDGYTLRRLHGQDTYRCILTGEWSPKIPPVCIKLELSAFNDPLEEVMCSSPPPIPHTDFERMEGWLTSNGALHGTVLEYTCRVGYRDSRTPCLPTRRTCHAGKWVGNLPSCVPFDYCERPPSISHGFMSTPPENVYRILFEVMYECHPGYKMKGSPVLKCAATGCWNPNELPQCIREDIYDSGWNGTDDHVPLLAVLSIVSVSCAVVAILTTSCLVIICRRKGGHVPPPAGPAHWSTTVTVTPECRPMHEQMSRRADQDRMALIAFADGVQVTLPSYEEALRDSGTHRPLPTTNLTVPTRGNSIFDSGLPIIPSNNGHLSTVCNSANSNSNGPSHINDNCRQSMVHLGLNSNNCSPANDSHAPHSPYRGHGINDNGNGHLTNANRLHKARTARGAQHHSVARNPHHDRSRHHQQNQNPSGLQNPSPDVWDIRENLDTLSYHSGPTWTARTNPNVNRRRGASGHEHDTLSDTMSHHSAQGVWPCRQPSATASLRSQQSGGSMETVGGVSAHSSADNNTLMTESHNSSQTPSCRALAGSLASFDTSSIVNTEGVPLLEDCKLGVQGSNMSETGDTGSGTYSEASTKTA